MAVDKVAPAVYASRLAELQEALDSLKRRIKAVMSLAENSLHEAHVASQFAAGVNAEPHQQWLDWVEHEVFEAGRRLQALAQGGRRRR